MGSHLPSDEEGRIGALYRHGVPGINMGEALDRIAKIAQVSLRTPIAAVSVVERSRQSFLAVRGLPATPLALDQSFCAQAIADTRPLIVEDATGDPRFAHYALVAEEPGVRAYLGMPLVSADGYTLGTVCVMDTVPRRFTEEDVMIVVNLARLAMSHLAARQPDSFDFLTGALTRRRFQFEVEREFERVRRYERPASLIFLDIDGFATINKTAGPEIADEVLRAVANRCMELIRSTDVFGRVGGEEFGLLLPETLAYEASQCAERLREVIARLRFRTGEGVLSVTASLGVAAYYPAIRSAVQWFAQADVALYAAKRAGRDCVAFAPPVADEPAAFHDEDRDPTGLNLH